MYKGLSKGSFKFLTLKNLIQETVQKKSSFMSFMTRSDFEHVNKIGISRIRQEPK